MLVNHNGAGCLPAALEALAAGTACTDVEGIVVDSGSRDGSWRGVEGRWAAARTLRFEDNIGFCAGCNRGAEEAAGRLLAFVNFDGRVEPGWDRPLRALLDDPGVAVATGLLLRPDGEAIEAAGLEIAPNMATYGRQEGEPRAAARAGPVEVPAASGALMMVRRDEFLALGGSTSRCSCTARRPTIACERPAGWCSTRAARSATPPATPPALPAPRSASTGPRATAS